ncbi:murein biosynthesis integral membrane protein MurJ [Marinobacterium sp. LSUCC0821]|jgi:putative peptidoglycan lipid II flippase|uniref:murein biosynthesis integral membrane protein MurJ n=1 Tax=Marinobacterium sp. LSUCC0821 TaxID=2668067 RepID=UPI0014525630|nr:murein biosynthesis integral membrane protein MurJ [Marinobacterium sp. LSUCC0821]QJD72372.1 murein biosynthesis integral membrane protein MurJ [Marinobacterium sp. LSUCC0821]
MTMISRVLGLIRDVVVAGYFGASGASDAFFVAFKIPNFLRRLFAEGAFAQAFVPVLSEYRTQRDLDAVRLLVAKTAGSLGSVLLVVTFLGSVGSPLLAMLFAPGFYMSGSPSYDLAAEMLRITFPYLMLISLTAFAGAILNSYQRFAVPAFTPVLLNLCLIGSAVYLSPLFDPPIMALAWGVLMAGAVQLIFQMPFLARLRLLPMPQSGWKDEGVRRILRLMLPALFGVSVAQINLLLDTVLASFLQTGSVSWLYYSDRLAELPLGVFGIAIATVILPSLSRKHAEKSGEQFAQMLDWAVRMVLLIGLPAALALILLAEPLLTTLFHYGQMSDRDVEMAAMSLRAYGVGLLAFMLIKVLAPGYFSRQDTKTPVKIAVKAMVANMVFNLMLIVPLAHAGLALATALSAFMNAGWLLHGLIKQGVFKWQSGWARWSMQLGLANLLMALFVLFLAPAASEWLVRDLWWRIEWMALLVGGAVAVYLVTLALTGVRIRHLRG